MGFSPLRWTKPPQMNVFCEIAFQEHPILSRVESVALISRWLGSEGIGKQAETFGFVAFRNIPSLCPCNYARLYPVARWNNSSPRTGKKTDAETLAEIRKALERPGDEFTNGNGLSTTVAHNFLRPMPDATHRDRPLW